MSASSRETNDPVVVGIGGGSGSGKSTVAALVRRRLEPHSVSVINQDRFFYDPSEMPTYYSALHGQPRPDFNHPDSTDGEAMVAACQGVDGVAVVILEGILVLHYPEARALMDIRCYVDTDLDQMLARRTKRNLAAGYGGTAEEIAHYNADCVAPQHRRFNAPTAEHADVLIRNSDGQEDERDRAIAEVCKTIEAALSR